MISDELLTELALGVEQGKITHEAASKLVRETVLAATPAPAPRGVSTPPALGTPWQGLVGPSQITDRQVVEGQLTREGHSEKRVLNMLIDAASTGYRDYQDIIKQARAADEQERVSQAEHRWLSETENGRQERERRITAEAQSILQAETEARTRADAARVILEKREGLPDTSKLTDAEVTSAVFGEKKDDLSNNLAANVKAANAGSHAQEGRPQA